MTQRQASSAAAAAAEKSASASSSTPSSLAPIRKAKLPWSPKETTTLIKAVKSFPGGTVARWEKIAEYVNLHGRDDPATMPERGPDECIKKSKEMQDASLAERNAVQAAAAASGKKKEVDIKEVPTAREAVETVAGKAKENKSPVTVAPAAANAAPTGMFVVPEGDSSWTAEQQAALEAGLRKFPAMQFSANPAERWDKIAAEIDGKNKKEVKQRVKDLHDAIKKKNKK